MGGQRGSGFASSAVRPAADASGAASSATQVSASAWQSARASPKHTTEPSPSPLTAGGFRVTGATTRCPGDRRRCLSRRPAVAKATTSRITSVGFAASWTSVRARIAISSPTAWRPRCLADPGREQARTEAEIREAARRRCPARARSPRCIGLQGRAQCLHDASCRGASHPRPVPGSQPSALFLPTPPPSRAG